MAEKGSNTPTPHLMETYGRAPLDFVRGAGSRLTTADGTDYLDFGSGVGVNILGHGHPALVAALTAQAEKLWHVSNLYTIAGQEKLAALLCEASFAERVFFCNSGAEAVEGLLKSMRKYHAARGAAERVNIITFAGAFHGRTLAALAAAGNPAHLEGFGPPASGFVQCPDFDLAQVEALIDDTTAGILIEPIQGESGVRDAGAEFLRGLRALCDDHGILLGCDEVQCGLGRTGRLFAHEWAGITPDIAAIAKGIGGGFPLGAVLATEAAGSSMSIGSHGSTFGGNPLAMAVGQAVLEVVLESGFLAEVEASAKYFRKHLVALVEKFPRVLAELRGVGLMVGLKCACPNDALVAGLRAEHMLSVPAGDNVVRLLPPLNVSRDDIDLALAALAAACARIDTEAHADAKE